VVDHFSQKSHSPYDQAETLEDIRNDLLLVGVQLQMGYYKKAFYAFSSDLFISLHINLEAYAEILSFMRPFFPEGWVAMPKTLDEDEGSILANRAAISLGNIGNHKEAIEVYSVSLLAEVRGLDWSGVNVRLGNLSSDFKGRNHLAKQARCLVLLLEIATERSDQEDLFRARWYHFDQLALTGQWRDAEAMWKLLNLMGRNWSRSALPPGNLEYDYAKFHFYKGDMTEEHLEHAERLARTGKSRQVIRELHHLRGKWLVEQGQYVSAAESLHEAVRMAREVRNPQVESETLLVLTRFHLEQLSDAHREAEQLAKAKEFAHRPLAELWLAMGECEHAKKHALAAYEWAWADGEPYVNCYELNQAHALLGKLGVEIPSLPSYNPAKDEKLPWEDEVAAAIEKLRAENEGKIAAKESEKE